MKLQLICALLLVAPLMGCPSQDGPPNAGQGPLTEEAGRPASEGNPPEVPAEAGTTEPSLRTYVLVIDGMIPETITPELTPEICRIAHCPGAPAPDGARHATAYAEARAAMLPQTNSNHVAIMTGAYGDVSGAIGNAFFDRRGQRELPLMGPAMILAPTVFDLLAANAGGQSPFSEASSEETPSGKRGQSLRTAVVAGKAKLRILFDCTTGYGVCAPSNQNPEGGFVSHVKPDFVLGAAAQALPGSGDCQAEPPAVFGVGEDACIMDRVLKLIADTDPGFMLINLGRVDYAQHLYGQGTPEATAAVREADTQVGRLVQHLKDAGKWGTSVLLLLADHSFSTQGAAPARRIDVEALINDDRRKNPEAWGASGGLEEEFSVIHAGGAALVALKSISGDSKKLTDAQADALRRMRQVALFTRPGARRAGISEALYRLPNPRDAGHTLAEVRPEWHLDSARTGDLVVTALSSGPAGPPFEGGNEFESKAGLGYALSKRGSFGEEALGNHGHPGTRHIPFIIASGGDFVVDQMVAASNPEAINEGDDTAALPEQAEVVDVAPTILWLHGMLPAEATDARLLLPRAQGRVLREAFKEGWVPLGSDP